MAAALLSVCSQTGSGSARTPRTSRRARCSSSSTPSTPWGTLCTTCTRTCVLARWGCAPGWTRWTAWSCSSTSATSTSQVCPYPGLGGVSPAGLGVRGCPPPWAPRQQHPRFTAVAAGPACSPCCRLAPWLAEVPRHHAAVPLSVLGSLETHLFLCSISLINILCLVLLITSIYLLSVISSAVSLLFIFPSCLIFLFPPFISIYLLI